MLLFKLNECDVFSSGLPRRALSFTQAAHPRCGVMDQVLALFQAPAPLHDRRDEKYAYQIRQPRAATSLSPPELLPTKMSSVTVTSARLFSHGLFLGLKSSNYLYRNRPRNDLDQSRPLIQNRRRFFKSMKKQKVRGVRALERPAAHNRLRVSSRHRFLAIHLVDRRQPSR